MTFNQLMNIILMARLKRQTKRKERERKKWEKECDRRQE